MASSVPGALQYWFKLATTTLSASTDTPNNSTPYVWFGKALPRYIAPVTLQILQVSRLHWDWAELGSLFKIEETYQIENQLVSYAGGTDFMQRMIEVFENYKLLSVALAADYTMGNNLRLCLPAIEGEVIPGAQSNGQSMCMLRFNIHCEVRIQSLS